jgi:predicted Zn finger-like uncharacterized protein
MNVRIACPPCQTAYVVPTEKMGKRGRCPSCGHSFTLVAADAADLRSTRPEKSKIQPPRVQRAEEEPVYVEPIADTPSPRERRAAKGKKKKTGGGTFWWVLGAGIFLFVGLCAAGLVAVVMYIADSSRQQKIASNDDTRSNRAAPPQVMNAPVADSPLKGTSAETTAPVVEMIKDATVFLKVKAGQATRIRSLS